MPDIKINPFRPDEPIPPMYFVGRKEEIRLINTSLNQTIAGVPQDALICGEKWIGKSSLAGYAAVVAQSGKEHGFITGRFLPIFCRLGACRTIDEICVAIMNRIHRRLTNSTKDKATKILASIRGITIGLFGIQFDSQNNEGAITPLFPDLLADLIPSVIGNEYDGILIILDETEQIARIEGCSSFLKNTFEFLRAHDFKYRKNISFLMTVTPEGFEQLRRGHASFPRLFRIAMLDRLKKEETIELVNKLLQQGKPICKIEEEALDLLCHYSDGFPGAIHELGYHAFAANKDDVIDKDDIINGIIGRDCVGALQSLYVKHFEPIYPSGLRSDKSFAIMKAFVDSNDEVISYKMLTDSLKRTITPTSIGAYLKNFIDKGTIVKIGDGQYKLRSRLFRLYLALSSKFGKKNK